MQRWRNSSRVLGSARNEPRIAEVIVSKNRFGPMGTAELKFDNRTSSFSELEDNDDDSAFNDVRAEDFF